jgi:tetratricopeptide (TPR) repeat protein
MGGIFFRYCLIVLFVLLVSMSPAQENSGDAGAGTAAQGRAPANTAQAAPRAKTQPGKAYTADQYYDAGEKYYNARRYDTAIRYYYAATQLDRNYSAAWKKLAFCYYKMGKHKYAYTAFQKVLEFDKTDKDANEFMDYYNGMIAKNKKQQEIRSALDPAWRSVVLPGWGQFYNNQVLKGTILSGGFLVSAGLTVYAVVDEKLKNDKYIKANENQDIAFKEAQSAWTNALIWSAVTGILYAGGIIDAAMNYDSIEARTIEARFQGGAIILCANMEW